MTPLRWEMSRLGDRALLKADGPEGSPYVVFAVDRETYAQNPLGVQQVIAARGYPPLPTDIAARIVRGVREDDDA